MGERKPKSEWQLQLRAIGEKYNVDFGMGDPELALAEAYELGRNSSKETLVCNLCAPKQISVAKITMHTGLRPNLRIRFISKT